MKYNFLMKDGSIKEVSNLIKFGKEKGVYSLTWGTMCNWETNYITKEENNILKELGLKNTIFNICCLRKLDCIYITEFKKDKMEKGE